MSGSGGGSSSGKIQWPDYLHENHIALMGLTSDEIDSEDVGVSATWGIAEARPFSVSADLYNYKRLVDDDSNMLGAKGEFNDVSGWSLGTGWTHSAANGNVTKADSTSGHLSYNLRDLIPNAEYEITIRVSDIGGGHNLIPYIGIEAGTTNQEGKGGVISVAGVHRQIITCNAGQDIRLVPSNSALTCTVDYVELRKVGITPYTDLVSYNPDTDIAATQNRLDKLSSIVDGWDENVDWDKMVSTALARDLELFKHGDAVDSMVEGVVRDGLKYAADSIIEGGEQALANIDDLINQAVDKSLSNLTTAVSTAGKDVADVWNDETTASLQSAVDVVNSSLINDQIDAYEDNINQSHYRSLNRFTGGMADINSVNGSQFIMGLALLERDRQADVNQFSANLRQTVFTQAYAQRGQGFQQTLSTYIGAYISAVQNHTGSYGVVLQQFLDTFKAQHTVHMQSKGVRASVVDNSVGRIAHLLDGRTQAANMATHLQAEVNRIKFVGKNEEISTNAEFTKSDMLWGLEGWQYPANVLASSSGGVGHPTSKQSGGGTSSVLGGALGGAASGASVAGVPGAIVGGIGGLVGSLF